MYVYSEEVDKLNAFLEGEYQIFQRQQQLFRQYIGLDMALSECLIHLTKHFGIYMGHRLLNLASQRVGSQSGFELGQEENEFLNKMYKVYGDFIIERVLESYNADLNNIPSEEDMHQLVDQVLTDYLQATLENYEDHSGPQNQAAGQDVDGKTE